MKLIRTTAAVLLVTLSVPVFASPKIQVKSAHQGCDYDAAICMVVRPAEGASSFTPGQVTFETGYTSATQSQRYTSTDQLNNNHYIWTQAYAQDIKNDDIQSVWLNVKSINGQPLQNCGIKYNTDPLQNHWGTISIYQIGNKYGCSISK